MPDSPPSADLDLRLVRYFVAVAEHRHFGRAAATLHVAQNTAVWASKWPSDRHAQR